LIDPILGVYTEKIMAIQKLDINVIRLDGNTQNRESLDQSLIYSYIENMKEGDIFPKLDVGFDGSHYWLVSGFHRWHSYKILGIKEVECIITNETLHESQVRSYASNATHGLPRTNAGKKLTVENALINPLLKDKSDYEIAKICKVSRSFVGAVRNPEVKEKQAESKNKHTEKKATKLNEKRSQTTSDQPQKPDPNVNYGPSEEEIKASEAAVQAYMEEIESVMQSDDKLAEANEVIKKQAHRIAQLESRMHGIMNEKNEAIKMVKKLQAENDKLKAKK